MASLPRHHGASTGHDRHGHNRGAGARRGLSGVDAAQWRDLVQKVLKGADFERRLVRTTADGIKVQPLYMAADAPADSGMPGSAPYFAVRRLPGRSPAAGISASSRPSRTPRSPMPQILEDLEGGATSIQLRLQARPDAEHAGSCARRRAPRPGSGRSRRQGRIPGRGQGAAAAGSSAVASMPRRCAPT